MKKTSAKIKKIIVDTLDENKAINITPLDVKKITDVTDYMIIATGNSTTHNKGLADKVLRKLCDEGIKPIGTEGEETNEWCLLDFGDVIVHIMLQSVREFYDLEKLWGLKLTKNTRSKAN